MHSLTVVFAGLVHVPDVFVPKDRELQALFGHSTMSHMVLLVSIATPVFTKLNALHRKHKRDTAHRS